MAYLLDTCVMSEFTRRHPNEKVIQWVSEADESDLYLSVITLGEIKRGIERLFISRRKDELSEWLDHDLVERFGKRLVLIDTGTMFTWGSLQARLERDGRLMPAIDSLIAASALQHGFTLVTRNEADFISTGVQLTNPWK